jgi:hypothetical protein
MMKILAFHGDEGVGAAETQTKWEQAEKQENQKFMGEKEDRASMCYALEAPPDFPPQTRSSVASKQLAAKSSAPPRASSSIFHNRQQSFPANSEKSP